MAATGPGISTVLNLEDVIEVRQAAQATDQVGLCVYHYRISALVGTPGLSDFVTALNAAQAAAWKACMSVNAGLLGFDARRILPDPPSTRVWITDSSGGGTLVGDVCPRQISGLIKKLTPFGGREWRGRWFVPFPSEGVNDANGLPLDLYMTPLTALAQLLRDSINVVGAAGSTATGKPVLLHRKVGFPFPTVDITLTSAVKKWATQRRRGSFGKTNLTPFNVFTE